MAGMFADKAALVTGASSGIPTISRRCNSSPRRWGWRPAPSALAMRTHFAAAAGTDYYAESSVGELLLGSLPVVES